MRIGVPAETRPGETRVAATPETVKKLADIADEAGSDAKNLAAAAKCASYGARRQRKIDEVNQGLARVQTIKRFAIITGPRHPPA
jgi:NAD/NADP transhydrogenase alpha subunit